MNAKAHYSQHGQDLFLKALFWAIGIEKPSYLDIGAHHPFNDSNTALFYENGSRGINVDANPNLMPAFKEHRPEDENINIGIGLNACEAPFYMLGDTNGMNSFIGAPEGFAVKKAPLLPLITINELIRARSWPQIFLTDAEGMDFRILEMAPFEEANHPLVVCSEISSRDSHKTQDLMARKGFFFLTRIVSDMIFVHYSLREKVLR